MLNHDFKCLRLLPTPSHLISLSNISLWSDVKYVATGDMWVVSPITSFGTSFSQQNKKKETTRHAIFLSNHFTIRPFSHVDLFSRRWQFIISSILKFLSAFFVGYSYQFGINVKRINSLSVQIVMTIDEYKMKLCFIFSHRWNKGWTTAFSTTIFIEVNENHCFDIL